MRRFSKFLLYVALTGFLLTVAANLLHRVNIAFLLFLAAGLLLLTGLFLLFLAAAYDDAGGQGAMKLRKFTNVFLFLSVVAFGMGILMLVFRMDGGREVIFYSCYALIAGLVLYIFLPPKYSRRALSPRTYRLAIASRVVMGVAAISFLLGFLMRAQHQPGGRVLTAIAVVLYITYILLLFLLRGGIKKNSMLNIPAIEVRPEDLDIYAGIYFNKQLKMHITVKKDDAGTSLSAQADGQNAFPLKPIEKDVFNYERAGIVMEFKPGKNEFILIQNGGYYVFNKE